MRRMPARSVVRAMFLVAGLAAARGGAVPHAQGRRPMSLIDITSVPRVLDPQLSPDGRSVLYALQKANWKTDRWSANVWKQEIGGGAPVQLTHGADDRLARWAPDGQTLVYFSGGQLFLLPAAGGEPKPLPRHATRLVFPVASPNDVGISWSHDGRFIYFIAKDPPKPSRASTSPLTVFEQTDFEQQHLWKVDVASGAEQQVTRGDWSVVSFRLAGDGRHAVVLRSPTPLVIDHYRSEVWTLDLATGEMRQVTKNNNYETEADLSPDGSQVYFIADANENLDDYYGPSLFVVPAGGGKPRRVSPGASYVVELAAWAADGKSLLAVVNMGVHSEIARIDVATGATATLTEGEHQIQMWSPVPSAGRMVYMLDTADRLGGDAWTLPIAGGAPARVTSVFDLFASEFALPRQERVSWRGADGVAVEGVLFYPVGYQPGRRYPLVVQLHGGPQISDKFGYGPGVFLNYVPTLTGKGYAVFRPNYRGSAGYGPAFYRDVVGHYFKNMHLDVTTGVDQLVKQGIADPDRIAVAGWSAGGTLVNKLITFSDRFKAASSGAGVADWVSLMAQTDVLTRRASWFLGTPWDKDADLDAFLAQSPIKDIAKVKTPTIFFVGEKDSRVPKPQAQEMYRGLEHNGVPTKLDIAPDEEHDAGGWSLRHTLGKNNDELEWFEKYVMGRSYTPELAPEPLPASR